MSSSAFGFPTDSMSGFGPSTGWVDPTGFMGDPNQLEDVILTTPAPSPNGTFIDLGNGSSFISPDAMGQTFDSFGNPIRANNGAGTAPAIQSVAGLVSAIGNLALGFLKLFKQPKAVVVQGNTPYQQGGTTAQVLSGGPNAVGRPPATAGGGMLLIGALVVGAIILAK